jgi:hypothetical protein
VGRLEILDCRDRYPPVPGGSVGRTRDLDDVIGFAVHHDAAVMEPGDRNYDGSTLDEDLRRLDLIYQVGLNNGWGGFPYHGVASPNGRFFYTCDLLNFGAHVARRNHELIGICLMGLFTHHEPGDKQLCAAGLGIVAFWHFLTRLRDLRGHREWAIPSSPTQCPGDTWWTWQRRLFLAAVLQGRLAFPES